MSDSEFTKSLRVLPRTALEALRETYGQLLQEVSAVIADPSTPDKH